MTFGLWLRRKREAVGMSKSQLARQAELSPQYIAKLENEAAHHRDGTPRPSLMVVDSLAEALRVPIAEARAVAGYAPPVAEVSARAQRALAIFESMDEGWQDMMIDVMELFREKSMEAERRARPARAIKVNSGRKNVA